MSILPPLIISDAHIVLPKCTSFIDTTASAAENSQFTIHQKNWKIIDNKEWN